MDAVKRTLAELCIVGLIGVALGLGTNAVRGSGSLKPTKNYFDKGIQQTKASSPVDVDRDARETRAEGRPVTADDPQSPGSTKDPKGPHLNHGYQEIRFEEVVEVYNDPATAAGVNVFIDARNDGMFEEGHIPGAVLCNPYEVEQYIDHVLECTAGVEKVIVYCEGGECEDSIFACRELIEAGVPYESIYLYPSGYEEWTTKEMPVQTGREER